MNKNFIIGWVFLKNDFCGGTEIYLEEGIYLNYEDAFNKLIDYNTPYILKELKEYPDAFLDSDDNILTDPTQICEYFCTNDEPYERLWSIAEYRIPIYT